MKIYGIYENDEYEECIYVGTIKEIAIEFGCKENSLRTILSRNHKLIQGNRHKRFIIKELYDEKRRNNK